MVLVMNGHFYLKTVHGFRPKVPAGVGAGHVSYAESNLASGMSDMEAATASLLLGIIVVSLSALTQHRLITR